MVAPWLFRRYALVVPWQRVGFGPVDKLLPTSQHMIHGGVAFFDLDNSF
jgi:hypothetical protein